MLPGSLSHFLTVLRDNPIVVAIALCESLSRSFMRLTFANFVHGDHLIERLHQQQELQGFRQ